MHRIGHGTFHIHTGRLNVRQLREYHLEDFWSM
jgi:hypothetical protein